MDARTSFDLAQAHVADLEREVANARLARDARQTSRPTETDAPRVARRWLPVVGRLSAVRP